MGIAFPHIQAAGSYRELGRAVGEGARTQIAEALAFYEEHFTAMAGISFAEADGAGAALPAVRSSSTCPSTWTSCRAWPKAAASPSRSCWCPTAPRSSRAAPTRIRAPHGDKPGGHFCTAVAVHTGGRHLLGHNMDWYVVDAGKNVLFDLTTPQGTRIVTIAGVPYLPILGMNSHGVAYVGNSLYSTDDRLGVPNAFVRRWVLESSSLEQAVQRATMPVRARGSNHLLADRAGRVWNVETSAADAVVTEHGEVAAHTNHYIEPAMQAYEGYHDDESRRRLAAARRRLVAGLQVGEDPLQLVRAVLRNHAGSPDSICGHADTGAPPAEQVMTVASMVCDLDEMRLHACAGPPCSNEYRSFSVGAS